MRPIDADSFDKRISFVCQSCAGGICEFCKFDELHSILDDTQTLDVAPVVHANWKWDEDHIGTEAIMKSICSKCNRSPLGFYWLPVNEIRKLPEYNFCPNCGAKMDER